ncbi:MAG: hypothetical protein MK008_03250 [Bdellovibrionales bacterium]|nr:hypothetical protein [Bdellovibrionales bacterium]
MFTCEAYGKWILAGEHAVLRGCPALVFPLKHQKMILNYTQNDSDLSIKLSGPYGDSLKLLVWGIIETAVEKLNIKRDMLKGDVSIESHLPLGAGLGASAALCVLMGRWFSHLGYVEPSEIYEFSRSLEDMFHGESSGVDIAVSLEGEAIEFYRGGDRTPLKVKWTPHWYLSSCGHIGVTNECVQQVKKLYKNDPSKIKLDEQMKEAVIEAKQALCSDSKEEGLVKLSKAIKKAESCFQQWGLSMGELSEHITSLYNKGALAVKPTGSGGGGYVLSLWESDPNDKQLMAL